MRKIAGKLGLRTGRGKRLALFALVVISSILWLTVGASQATVTCSFDLSAHTVSVSLGATGDVALIKVGPSGSFASAVIVNGEACTDGVNVATTGNTDLIDVNEVGDDVDPRNTTVVIDLSGGAFAPGFTNEGDGSSEIEFDISLGAGSSDALKVIGSSGPDNIAFGSLGINLNSGVDATLSDVSDVDVVLSGVEKFEIQLGDGNDVFTGAGGSGTGGAFALGLVIFGEDGDDNLTGGTGDDYIDGGAGNEGDPDASFFGAVGIAGHGGTDTLIGGPGNDVLDGGVGGCCDPVANSGDDVLLGGEGRDSLLASDFGNNTMDGGPGDDKIFGFGGNDDLIGGPGNDFLSGGNGNDFFDEGSSPNGADVISGGAGSDTVDYSGRIGVVSVTKDGAANDGEAGEGDNVGGDVEKVLEAIRGGGLAFSSDRSEVHRIFTMTANGGGQQQITSTELGDRHPSWSPDGARIAFAHFDGNDWEIWSMAADGGNQTALTNNTVDDFAPDWSPDGSKIAFHTDRDGNHEIYVMNADGTAQTNVSNSPSTADRFPSWSPDGTKIAFVSCCADTSFEIYVMNSDGSNRRNLSNNPATDLDPAWSPDGSKIAWSSCKFGCFDIYTINPDGTGETRLTSSSGNNIQPAWSPDGSKLLFVTDRDGNNEIYVMNGDSTGQINLTNNPADERRPDWVDNLTLTALQSSVPASPTSVPIDQIPIQNNAPDLQSAPLPTIGVGPLPTIGVGPLPTIGVGPLPTIGVGPLPTIGVGPLPTIGVGPLPTIGVGPLVRDAFDHILLSSIPLRTAGGWTVILAGTALEGRPLQEVTLLDVMSLDPPPPGLPSLKIGDVDFSKSELGSIDLMTLVLGRTRLGDIQIPISGWDWCVRLSALGYDCAGLGGLDTSTLYLQIAGVPFNDPVNFIPLHAVRLKGVTFASDAPLAVLPLNVIDLGATNLGATMVSSIPSSTRGQVVDCGSTDCASANLAKAQDDGAIKAGARLDHLRGSTADDLLLGEIVYGLVGNAFNPIGSFPYDTLGIRGYGGAGSSAIDYRLSFAPAGVTQVSAPTVTIKLPRQFTYVSGSTIVQGTTEDDPTIFQTAEATVLTWEISREFFREAMVLEFKARPGERLGVFTASASVRSSEVAQAVTNRAPVEVTENLEPNDSASSAISITPDTLYVAHLHPGDEDFYSFPAPPEGSRIRVFLDHLPVDADLVLYHPAGTPRGEPLRQPKTSSARTVPLTDEGTSLSNSGEPLGPEPSQDIDFANLPIAGLSENRGTASDFVQALSWGAGNYTIQVAPYNGAFSALPYTMRVEISPPAALGACPARSFPHGTSTNWSNAGTFPSSIPTSTKTLFLVNKDRLADRYGASAATNVMNKLNEISTFKDPNGNPIVSGAVLSVDGLAAVRSSFEAWDANSCDPELANDVVRKINAGVDALLTSSHDIEHIVVVGSHEDIPDAWIFDLTQQGNETTFLQDLSFFDANNSLIGGAAKGYLRSLDPYGDFDPTPYLDRWLYVTDVGLGRVGESPSEIITALQKFIDFGGMLDDGTATRTLSTGYEFFEDLGKSQDATFEAQTGAPQDDLFGPAWTVNDLVSKFTQAADVPDYVALNAHFDQHRALPPGATSEAGLFTTQHISDGKSLDRRLILTMGCHSAYSVADVLVSAPVPQAHDWPQAVGNMGGLFAGQSGFGLGLGSSVALTEKIMDDFAANLDDGVTVGQALMLAKQNYLGGSLLMGVYDSKVVQQSLLAGLPMYRTSAGVTASSAQAPTSKQNEPVTGLKAATIDITPTFTKKQTPEGDYYQASLSPQSTIVAHNRPVQPKVTVPLVADPAVSGEAAHGVLITGLESMEETNFNPVLARFLIGADQPEADFGEAIFPAVLQDVSTFKTIDGNAQNAVFAAGQFLSTGMSGTELVGIQRRFTKIKALAYFSTGSDFVKPVFSSVDAFRVSSVASFALRVSDETASGNGTVERVLIVYREKGSAVWKSVDLAQSAPGSELWTGGVVLASPVDVEYFAQAVDASGNVGVTTRKGEFYIAGPLPAAPEGVSVVVEGTPAPNSPWLRDATVTITGPEGADIDVSIDGAEFTDYAGPFAITGDGVHRVDYRVGETTGSAVVPIDANAPAVVIASPVNGAVYLLNQAATASYVCIDAASGVIKCDGTVGSGAALDTSTPGTKTFSVTTQDAAGHSRTVTHTYHVQYLFEGFLQPVDNDKLNVVQGGRGVPMKWRLKDANGNFIRDLLAVVKIESRGISCEGQAQNDVNDTVSVGLSTLTYDLIDEQFKYVWETFKEWKDTCRRFELTLNDGTVHTANFKFK